VNQKPLDAEDIHSESVIDTIGGGRPLTRRKAACTGRKAPMVRGPSRKTHRRSKPGVRKEGEKKSFLEAQESKKGWNLKNKKHVQEKNHGIMPGWRGWRKGARIIPKGIMWGTQKDEPYPQGEGEK